MSLLKNGVLVKQGQSGKI